MSITFRFATATCEVSDDFSLTAYVNSLADFIANHIDDDKLDSDVRAMFCDCTLEETAQEIQNYLEIVGNEIQINLDTDESNCDNALWNWLCNQVRNDVMTNKVMMINYGDLCSKYGFSCGQSMYTKSGTFYDAADIASLLEKAILELN